MPGPLTIEVDVRLRLEAARGLVNALDAFAEAQRIAVTVGGLSAGLGISSAVIALSLDAWNVVAGLLVGSLVLGAIALFLERVTRQRARDARIALRAALDIVPDAYRELRHQIDRVRAVPERREERP